MNNFCQAKFWTLPLIWGSFLISGVVQSAVFAQVVDRQVIIEKEKEVKIKPANKPFEKILPLELKPNNTQQQYNISEPRANFKKLALISEATPPQDSDENYEEEEDYLLPLMAYIKAGGGNYATSFLEAYLEHRPSEMFHYQVDLKHLASRNGAVLEDYSGQSRNQLGLEGTYFLPTSSLTAALNYRRDVNRFYGYNEAQLETLNQDDLRKVMQRLDFTLSHAQTNADSPLFYRWQLGAQAYQDNFDAQERTFSLSGELRYAFGEQSFLGLNSENYFSRLQYDNASINRNLLSIAPYYQLQIDRLNVNIGAQVVYENDTLSNKEDVHIYPKIAASYQVLDGLGVFANLQGNIQPTFLYEAALENPFLEAEPFLFHQNQLWEATIGTQIQLNNGLNLRAKAAYGAYDHLRFFINAPADSAKMLLTYNPNTSNILSFGLEAAYEIKDKYSLVFASNFYNYSLDGLSAPWHRPRGEVSFLANAYVLPQLRLEANFNALLGLQGLNPQGEDIDLDNIFDISIEAEYLFSNKFSAFLSGNNLFSNTYQRYLYYPVQGINVLIGVTYAF